MTRLKTTALLLLLVFYYGTTTAQNKPSDCEIFFADPTIHVENGKYYLSGTRNKGPLGFAILESYNLVDWKVPETADNDMGMILAVGEHVYGSKGFWAPQFLKENFFSHSYRDLHAFCCCSD